ncbi:UPF0280 family protein [Litorisediminicola beolgyonensis]|uniref:UPF0280 family protein n=1 Tax=Litorisediminicola beolgyonensis TaxID=1173614 RepID=A0ABW3ZHF2_9RHOB
MSGPVAAMLPGGRLHLQHGPIDLVIGAEGGREAAFRAAARRFETVLEELVGALELLRQPVSPAMTDPREETARRMVRAARTLAAREFLTPMAAVAGSVAETVLDAMRAAAPLRRAYVNNGGDIALHLAEGETYTAQIAGPDGQAFGRVTITANDPVRGIATSGRHGRSLSLGIADSVTVLAATASEADAAATLIANAVDLPGHPAITRRPANAVRDDSDLGTRAVVTACGALARADRDTALLGGLRRASDFRARGKIFGAALFLQGEARMLGPIDCPLETLTHA